MTGGALDNERNHESLEGRNEEGLSSGDEPGVGESQSGIETVHGEGNDQQGLEEGRHVHARGDEPVNLTYNQLIQFLKQEHTEISDGPLPPPSFLEKYEHTMPGAAERVFAMAEKSIDTELKISGRASWADAIAKLFSTVSLSLLPWALIVLTGVLAYSDKSSGALLSGLALCLCYVPRIMETARKPRKTVEDEGKESGKTVPVLIRNRDGFCHRAAPACR